MWIGLLGQTGQELGHIVSAIKSLELPAARLKSRRELGFSQNVESGRRFAEEHYPTYGQEVKSSLEGALEPLASLRQSRNSTEIPGKQGDDAACLAEVGKPDHQSV